MTENSRQETELALIAPIQGGQMLARRSGQAVFIQGGMPGETVEHGQLVAKRGYLEGEAYSVVQAAPARTVPPCPYFGENGRTRGSILVEAAVAGPVCGGCQYQHITYAGQLEIKAQIVREQMRRVGKILDAPVAAVTASPSTSAYRNKAAWIIGPTGELAYHEARSHRLVPVDQCLLLSPSLRDIFDRIRAVSTDLRLSGLLRSVEARSLPAVGGGDAGSMALTFEEGVSEDSARNVAQALIDACPSVVAVSGTTVDSASEYVHLAGAPRVRAAFLDADLSLSPSTFFQVNLAVAELMATYILEQIGSLDKRVALDVYCGAGTFTAPAATRSRAVIALELEPLAVADLRDSLSRAGMDNVTVLQGDAGLGLRSLLPGTIDCAVLDPPRSGCSKLVLSQLARIRIPRLVYVSCDPSTLARDLRQLLDQGFVLESIVPFDLFPQTAHIECVATLKLPKKYQRR